MSTVIKRNPEIVHSDMDGEVVMMSINNGEYYGTDAIGSHIWNLLEEEISLEVLCARVCARYDVSEAECRKDIEVFLSELLENKIVFIE